MYRWILPHLLLFLLVVVLASCSNDSHHSLMNGQSFTITQPTNGVFALDFTTTGHVHVGISRWNGPPLTMRNYALAQISTVSGRYDTVMTHMEDAHYVSVILSHSGIKYRCLYGNAIRSGLILTIYAGTITVINYTNCELDDMTNNDAQLLEILSSERSDEE